MYLNRILLNTRNKNTMKALSNRNHFHGAISMATQGEKVLWRLDRLGDKTYLLILSHSKVDWGSVQKQFGFAEVNYETLDYAPLICKIKNDEKWHFRLVANPIKNCKKDGLKQRGKRCAHVTFEQQENWLRDRASKLGFSLNEGEFRAIGNEWLCFEKANCQNKITILSVAFEGILRITDLDLFKQTLLMGVGKGKAYGLGLLTLAR